MHQLAHHCALQFAVSVIDLAPLGNGLINDTFLVTTSNGQFVLQRINARVFPAPEAIIANLLVIDQHLRQKTTYQLKIPGLLTTLSGDTFYKDEHDDCWRAQHFIEQTISLEAPESLADAQQVGFALGHFHQLLSDLDASLLNDTLPGFHIAPDYLARYLAISQQSILQDTYCTHFIERFTPFVDQLENAKHQGILPIRTIHGDPKLNNFLFNQQRSIVSLIDLDTVKPGLVHYDIGDCLRSCCHDLANDRFDLAVCAAVLKTYLAETGQFFSDAEYALLFAAIQLIPFELGLRFYTDYLEGNRYFKVTQPEQNLHRAISQFRLCADITDKKSAICALIDDCKPATILPS